MTKAMKINRKIYNQIIRRERRSLKNGLSQSHKETPLYQTQDQKKELYPHKFINKGKRVPSLQKKINSQVKTLKKFL
jgi:hypothetical protein